MGGAKRLMEEQEATRNSVLGRLIDAGAVSECEVHDDILLDNDDSEAVEQVTAELAEEIGKDKAERQVENAMQQVGDECPICAKHAMED